MNAFAGPGAGAATGAAESSIVPNSDRVPSRLSMISIRRACSGQSMCDAVLICQKPSPRGRRGNHAVRVRVARHERDHVRVRLSRRRHDRLSRPGRDGSASRLRGSASQPGSPAGLHAPASLSGARVVHRLQRVVAETTTSLLVALGLCGALPSASRTAGRRGCRRAAALGRPCRARCTRSPPLVNHE